MTNKVNIEFLKDQLEKKKALKDIEKLKDKQREFANGNGHLMRITRQIIIT